jgi:hypothetical protein
MVRYVDLSADKMYATVFQWCYFTALSISNSHVSPFLNFKNLLLAGGVVIYVKLTCGMHAYLFH